MSYHLREVTCDGIVVEREYYDDNSRFHSDNGPAFARFFNDGKLSIVGYYTHGLLNNKNGPALIRFLKSGLIQAEHYYLNGLLLNKCDWELAIKNIKQEPINQVANAKDFPCPKCSRMVSSLEKECWWCGKEIA